MLVDLDESDTEIAEAVHEVLIRGDALDDPSNGELRPRADRACGLGRLPAEGVGNLGARTPRQRGKPAVE